MKLDPYFGESSGSGLLCELRLSVISAETNRIATTADRLWLSKDPSAALARLDLRKSSQALRDAADRLDALLDKNAVKEAAE